MKTTLKALRKEHNLTQRELSKILEVSQSQYSAYENGKLRMPVAFLIRAAEYYETSVDYIICRVKRRQPYPHFFKPRS